MPNQTFDPLAARRTEPGPEVDLFVWGTVFLDMIFAGLPVAPSPGTEVWAEGLASCPGGIANLAVAARRLGLRTSLAAAFSDDDYGDFCWRTLEEQEGIDLSRSRRFPEWHSPVTVSMSVEHDRSMVSHGHPPPLGAEAIIGTPPSSRAVHADLSDDEAFGTATPTWVDRARSAGALVFADVGWDPAQTWSSTVIDRLERCDVFMPNAVEAMAYTSTSTPLEALYLLADRVPVTIVTDGANGALGIDARTGEEARVPSLRVHEVDPTGAGDVFGAAVIVGTLAEWPLDQRLAFASLCAGLTLQQYGGSLAAPGWGDIADWWTGLTRDVSTDAYHRSLRRRFAFLDEIVPRVPVLACRRATATIARRADVHDLA
ncbi:carbohydrate kinase [Intrasporangium oryzae NRRL B-24470]|uniref:Carbohydrate kinase n=1 Tax=Intrasporangium oryzae NRRL B-24470 TaxID=1386089 RepID=W9G575_9MICO|nr:PfkB family carbohydrate kinase [Intrasporangium oryzae]EWT01316.1 carbohydrate kinase [Intrasporangium oryzae NRRL B-24470]